jgi:ParB/RepB/Spo0J family partition protein
MLLKDLVVSKCNAREIKEDAEGIKELGESIKEFSLISKIILRPGKDGKFEIVAGQRRFLALKDLLGDDHELPVEDYVVMKDLTDEKAYILSITENQQRLDLSPMELNAVILKLNSFGYKDKEIAKILNITPHRLKRLSTLAQDERKMPEAAKIELHKPIEESSLTDAHWDKIRDVENEDVIKDVVDFIIDKEAPPRDVPTIIKAVEKQFEKENPPLGDEDTKPATHLSNEPPVDLNPIEYAHRGELVLDVHGDEKILKVLGKGTENEEEVVPVEHYMEYLLHPEKFRCYVTFKLKIKPIE